MKKIGLLSDTHGYIDDRIIRFLQDRDEIWHAGDWGDPIVSDELEKIAPVRGVYGNIDGKEIRSRYPENNRFMIEGVDVWITHIGGYPGRYDIKVREKLRKSPPHVFISGHSHILKVMRDKRNGLLHINPGAAGKSGFHKMRTLILMEVGESRVLDLKVVELGARGVV